ncbi:MAG: hypothetical protein IT442_04860 [Phycisphaeraceae bacterium]|nr:hypothetical protein [Phycisphaeraceae bacterium]
MDAMDKPSLKTRAFTDGPGGKPVEECHHGEKIQEAWISSLAEMVLRGAGWIPKSLKIGLEIICVFPHRVFIVFFLGDSRDSLDINLASVEAHGSCLTESLDDYYTRRIMEDLAQACLKEIARLLGLVYSHPPKEHPMQDSDIFGANWRALDYPVYRSHKAVKAFKILAVLAVDGENNKITSLLGKSGQYCTVSDEWMHRHHPKVGGYVVFYHDGYVSYSPAEAFESGYTLLPHAFTKDQAVKNYVEATIQSLKDTPPSASQVQTQAQRNVETDCTVTQEELDAAASRPRGDDPIGVVTSEADRLVRRSGSWIGGRSLATHSPSNVASIDGIGPGGAHHHYKVMMGPSGTCDIWFFRGPRNSTGAGAGLFEDDLLAILEDRMACFERGEFSHPANHEALLHIQKAREALAGRVAERLARGVLGKHEK